MPQYGLPDTCRGAAALWLRGVGQSENRHPRPLDHLRVGLHDGLPRRGTDSGQVPRGDAPDRGAAGLPREAEGRGREAGEKGGKEPRGKIQGQRRKASRRQTADEEEIPRADSPQWRNPCRDAAPMPLLALQVAARLDRQPAPAGQTAFLLLPKPQRHLRPVHTIPQMVHPGSRLWQRPKGLATVTVAQARQGNQAVPFQQLLLLG